MVRLYLLVALCLLAVYALIAVALEMFVLPRQVYGPIRSLLYADDAVQRGERLDEIIPENEIPADELGEIMRSRNETVRGLRRHEDELAAALGQLEETANDLKRKNHLLETAKQNLADQDRLVSLGMLSAGIAHELNTPLAVLKGGVEEIAEDPSRGVEPARAKLLLRVVHRLERLSESLLGFARAKAPTAERFALRAVVEEAWTLVQLDRGAAGVRFRDETPTGAEVYGDADRIGQVFVNILRNAVDALGGEGGGRCVGGQRGTRGARVGGRARARRRPGDRPGGAPQAFRAVRVGQARCAWRRRFGARARGRGGYRARARRRAACAQRVRGRGRV